MELLKWALIVSTAIIWSYTLINPVEAVRKLLKVAVWMTESKIRMAAYILFGFVMWYAWITVFGWLWTIGISLIGGITGAVRGASVHEEMQEMFEEEELLQV